MMAELTPVNEFKIQISKFILMYRELQCDLRQTNMIYDELDKGKTPEEMAKSLLSLVDSKDEVLHKLYDAYVESVQTIETMCGNKQG